MITGDYSNYAFAAIGLGVLIYIFIKRFSKKEKGIEKEFDDILNSEEYKVKGQYD